MLGTGKGEAVGRDAKPHIRPAGLSLGLARRGRGKQESGRPPGAHARIHLLPLRQAPAERGAAGSLAQQRWPLWLPAGHRASVQSPHVPQNSTWSCERAGSPAEALTGASGPEGDNELRDERNSKSRPWQSQAKGPSITAPNTLSVSLTQGQTGDKHRILCGDSDGGQTHGRGQRQTGGCWSHSCGRLNQVPQLTPTSLPNHHFAYLSGQSAAARDLWEGLSSLPPARGNTTRSERRPGA